MWVHTLQSILNLLGAVDSNLFLLVKARRQHAAVNYQRVWLMFPSIVMADFTRSCVYGWVDISRWIGRVDEWRPDSPYLLPSCPGVPPGCRPEAGFPESVEVGLEHPPDKPPVSLSTSLRCGAGEKWGQLPFGWGGGGVHGCGGGVFTLGIPRWPGWWNEGLRQEGPSSS